MKMHVAINVRNLEPSLAFYRILFNSEPTKVKENYAKFELDDPALHFSLNVRPFESKGVLNHLGFQVKSTDEVLAAKERLQQAGLVSFDEMNTTCCYAVQDKIWVTDPEGNPWEVFFTHKDSEFEAAEDRAMPSVCCAPSTLKPTINKVWIKGVHSCC
ncbi:glyoxalase/bleomycin resistance/dioxygenase family protein [Paenibacillus antri]|uniref:Glyoxalase/bleomycin resistance/dioxygenase family protein n=1 Tax=Paenibacillus antri TaxID=2582848 RepID=A0A5R9G9Z7_9BACL|nr:ArsI/CadI family heavy metal resistance metalloenzyme [Paenibacillus antri]TLS51929.1 glyoxalase/bleomycin resistance/dioxygenase family protein [Paenibacillus antri]